MNRREGLAVAKPEPARVPLALIADADEDTRAFYRQACEDAAYDVIEAADGRDALVQALAHVPSIVVSELTLPYIDGLSLCQILRQDRQTAGIRLLIATAEPRLAQLTHARSLGATVLLKPVDLDRLMTEMERLLAPDEAHVSSERATPAGEPSTDPVMVTAASNKTLVKSFARFVTISPPLAPLAVFCPECDGVLRYQRSHVGGVSQRHPEQWDYFVCSSCGPFQYRHRTRKLMRCDESSLVIRSQRARRTSSDD